MIIKPILAAVILAAASIAQAGPLTGNDLMRGMRAPEGSTAWVTALRYVQGGVDSLAAAGAVCPPDSADNIQARDMLRKLLEAEPQVRSMQAGQIVTVFFMSAWPCAKQKMKGPST